MKKLVRIALLVFCCAVIAFELWHFRSGSSLGQPTPPAAQKHKPDFVLLPESQVAAYAQFFADPKSHIESWEPTVADINDLNSSLSQISALSDKVTPANLHIDDPDQYFRQYLAVAINGKKTIFVNAMCSVEQAASWRKQLVVANGGGKCRWHAIYDPGTEKFSNLIINGST